MPQGFLEEQEAIAAREREEEFGPGGGSLSELTRKAGKGRRGRRRAFAVGGEEMIAAAEEQPEIRMKQAERGGAQAVAMSGETDIRGISGTQQELRRTAAEKIAEDKMKAGATKMDVAEAVERAGTEAGDVEAQRKEFMEGMYQIINSNKNWYDDDEPAMRRGIYEMVAGMPEDDPLRLEFEAKADSMGDPNVNPGAGYWNP